MIQGHFEAQKNGLRQTSKGVVISLLIHPNDISPSFIAADIGTRFQIGYAEMDDETIPAVNLPVMKPGEGGGGEVHAVALNEAATTADLYDDVPDWRV